MPALEASRMSKLILLIVGAAWMAVLLPPLVRAKLNGSPSNSVSNFRRQLYSLENSGGRRPVGQLRGMARPLAPSPRRGHAIGRLSHVTAPLVRPEGVRHHRLATNLSPHYMLRQRRQHLVVGLAGLVAASLFLAFTTGSTVMVYIFTMSLLALIGYCYVLVQLRLKRENERYVQHFRRVA